MVSAARGRTLGSPLFPSVGTIAAAAAGAYMAAAAHLGGALAPHAAFGVAGGLGFLTAGGGATALGGLAGGALGAGAAIGFQALPETQRLGAWHSVPTLSAAFTSSALTALGFPPLACFAAAAASAAALTYLPRFAFSYGALFFAPTFASRLHSLARPASIVHY